MYNKYLVPVVLILVFSGCYVQSLNPWLPQQTVVRNASLSGVWIDKNQAQQTDAIVILTGRNEELFSVQYITVDGTFMYTATLHLLNGRYFLVLGPDEPGSIVLSAVDAYMLFEVEFWEDRANIYQLDTSSWSERMHMHPSIEFAVTNASGYVLVSSTEEVYSFVLSQMSDPSFFAGTPLLEFRKISD